MKKATKAVKAIFGRPSKSSKSDESRKTSAPPIKAPPSVTASTISEAALSQSPPPTRTEPEPSPQDPPTTSKLSTVEPVAVDFSGSPTPDKSERAPAQTSENVHRRSAPSKTVSELEEVIKEFKENYSQFVKKNQKYVLIDEELQDALSIEIAGSDIRYTAKIFGDNISKTRQITERKKSVIESTWTGQVKRFFTKLYPVAKLSCGLMGAIAEGASFAPLKGASSGLGIILQILEGESGRSEDFLVQLRRIEFQAALLADNPSYDLNLEVTQSLLTQQSTELLSAIIKFLNSTLVYLSSGFFANLWKTSVNGPEIYTAGKEQLNNAILQYDRAVMHLTAHVVATMKYGQENQHNAEFLQWLSPSYWAVESLLSSFRQQRSEGTLEWARDMPEFQAWRLSDLNEGSERRITWINGTLGIGKSIMAAYFIDLLKCQYPKATVAYFFCRSNQPGLTRARDILRTLAYQCIEKDKAARTTLENLKSKGFQISEDLYVGFLFEKLLLDPLRNTPEIFIILDGLDEADTVSQDHTDRSGRPELHVLLSCLAKLPSTRLLCISRPNANISNFLTNAFNKAISKNDNEKDIDSYVKKTVSESRTLESLFKACYTDPIQYFRDKGSGIFLWVVLVLQQLKKAQSKSVFRNYLNGFSAASGSMETLYSTILVRIDENYKEWVREIIRWLIVAEKELSVKELQSLVECCLQHDVLVDFKHFLVVECGSILHFLPQKARDDNVRLVHETFRSFIVNPDVCPQSFLINETETHSYVTLKCLQFLTNAGGSMEYKEYALKYWVNHLKFATSTQYSMQLLMAMHQLFTSEGLKLWVKWLCNDSRPGFKTSVETQPLQTIVHWLRTSEICTAAQQSTVQRNDIDTYVGDALIWRCAALEDLSILGEAMGKAATAIWLHERLTKHSVLFGCFSLALKYYLRRTNRSKSNLVKLRELVTTRFTEISVWAGCNREIPIVNKNIGLALYVLYRWDECVDCLNITEGSLADDSPYVRRYLALSFMARRDYDGVIQVLENHCECYPNLLRRAYEAKGEYDKSIKIFRNAYVAQPSSRELWECLYNAHQAKGDHDAMIDMLESYQSKEVFNHDDYDYWWRTADAYETKGHRARVSAIIQAVIDENPKIWTSWYYFARIHYSWSDYEGAIRILELGILECPKYMLYYQLAITYMSKGDNDAAIQTVNSAIEKFETEAVSGPVLYSLIGAYRNKGDRAGLVSALTILVDQFPTVAGLWYQFAQMHIENEDYDGAIKVCKRAIEGPEFLSWDLNRLLQLLFTAYTKKCDYAKAIKVFESKVNLDVSNQDFWLTGLFNAYEAMGDYDGAIKAFIAMVDAGDDRKAWAWPGLLKAAAAKGDFDPILETLESAFDSGQLQPSAKIGYIIFDVYNAKGNHDGVVQKFIKMVNLLPLESWTWHLLGEAYKAKGDHKKAIEVYHEALEHISTDYSFYKRLCNLYLAISDCPRVLECYQKAKQFAEDPCLWAYLRFRPWEYGRSQITIDSILREHFIWHSVGEAYKKLGNFSRAQELFGVATSAYETALGEKYNRLLWYHNEICFASNGELADAFATKQNLPTEVLWFAAGEAYRANGNMKCALKAFTQAQALQPQNAFLHDIVSELERALADRDIITTANLELSSVVETEGGTKPTSG